MAIQPCVLSYGDGDDRTDYGIALIDTVTNLALQISCHALKDQDDADAFLRWVFGEFPRDIRSMHDFELTDLSVKWNGGQREKFCREERATLDEEDIRQ